ALPICERGTPIHRPSVRLNLPTRHATQRHRVRRPQISPIRQIQGVFVLAREPPHLLRLVELPRRHTHTIDGERRRRARDRVPALVIPRARSGPGDGDRLTSREAHTYRLYSPDCTDSTATERNPPPHRYGRNTTLSAA